MERRELTEREKRHKRRKRNEIIAYTVFICFLAAIISGGYFGVKYVVRTIDDYNAKVEQAMNSGLELASGQEEEPPSTQQPTEYQTEATTEEALVDPLDELVDALLADMTLEEKVAGMFMVTPESITGVTKAIQAKEGTKKAIQENPVGGLIYSEKNYRSDEQFTQMIADTRSYSKFPMFFAVQRETGKSNAFGIGETPQAIELSSAADVQNAYATITDKLKVFGINMNLAPVADVVSEEGNKALQGRTFGSDAASAALLVKEAVNTLQAGEISAVLQKFPGEGAVDSTNGNQLSKSLEELRNSEFIIYQMAIASGTDCIMISNTKAPELTGDDMPCSLSRTVITDVLRQELGFDGVVITSALNEKSVTSILSSKEAAVMAIMAGADMILSPADYKEAYNGVLEAISEGTITSDRIEESLHRIYRIKYKNVDFGS